MLYNRTIDWTHRCIPRRLFTEDHKVQKAGLRGCILYASHRLCLSQVLSHVEATLVDSIQRMHLTDFLESQEYRELDRSGSYSVGVMAGSLSDWTLDSERYSTEHTNPHRIEILSFLRYALLSKSARLIRIGASMMWFLVVIWRNTMEIYPTCILFRVFYDTRYNIGKWFVLIRKGCEI